MITTTVGSAASTGLTSGTTGASSLGRDQFLRLLVAQLKNQDPMSPLEPHEFAAQLAQFTSVEKLEQIEGALSILQGQNQLSSMLSETAFSASLVGRTIVAEGRRVHVSAGTPASVTVDIGGTGGRATLKLKDASGREVATRELGPLAPGRQSLTLPADLPAGNYTYELSVVDAEGKAAPVKTYTTGTVSSVRFANGRIVLSLGDFDVSLDDLVEIASPATTGVSDRGA
jgi:flagellar basal-body rod modification protein FlgD